MSIKKAYNSWAEQYDTRDLDKKATIETLSKYNFDVVLELGGSNRKYISTTSLLTTLNLSFIDIKRNNY
ncbi:hypothetical protein [Maribacter stanieri]|uniref:hypothetical protein n=1 Tax=Maribacter stanieri TaxID=440514 RepID=UPI002494867D|nr:hypothetical protein [Maribacter stanieri]|tara:strand:- start:424 stop:630 length:207 start_codon:yes stop_codon:yes gene_type:complete